MTLSSITRILCVAAALAGGVHAAEPIAETTDWHEVAPANVEGQGWTDTEAPFDRLPARAKQLVRVPVWDLSRDSAGLCVRFVTDAKSIAARWSLNTEELDMYHMPATGVSGVDLYVRGGDGWHYLGTGRATQYPTNTFQIVSGLEGAKAEYCLYFPLYNGVTQVEVGVPANASFEFVGGREKRAPIVVYGTSITQGGCASRPGMSYTSILSRRLDAPVVNLGFSGNGKSEPELAHLLAELDPAAYVLDPLPNMFPEDVERRLPEFIEIIRSARPTTPILLVENPLYPNIEFVASGASRVNDSNERLRRVYALLKSKGDQKVSIIPACDLTANQGEATVDGIHPTDLGFIRLADAIEPYLRKAID